MDRRDFVKTTAAAGLTAAIPAPLLHLPRAVKPVVISDYSGIRYKNGGPRSAVEEAFMRITSGADVLKFPKGYKAPPDGSLMLVQRRGPCNHFATQFEIELEN